MNKRRKQLTQAVDVTTIRDTYLETPCAQKRDDFFQMHPEYFGLLSFNGTLEQINLALEAFLGLGSTWRDSPQFDAVFNPRGFEPWSKFATKLQAGEYVEFKGWFPHANDGSMRLLRFNIRPMQDTNGHLVAYTLTGLDLSAEADQHDELERSALQDMLTGLHNRRYINGLIEDLISRYAMSGDHFAIMLLDLNKFKSLNDSLGHAAGDFALQHVARALQSAVPVGDVVGRLGGDEFIIIIEDCVSGCAMHALAEEIRQAVAMPFIIGTQTVRIDASIGVALFPEDGSDCDELLATADRKMFLDKNEKSQQSIVPYISKQALGSPELMRDLFDALSEKSQVVPYYQPIVDLETGRITSAEALCRWIHPDLGVLGPASFVPMAEHHDLIGTLDLLMLRQVCQMCTQHRPGILSGMRIYTNVSAATVGQAEFGAKVLNLLEEYGIPCSAIGLELTESMALAESEQGRENMLQLNAAGVDIALDDFGTGFSSLSLLKDLPVSRLKLDRSFIHGVDSSERQLNLVSAIVTLSKALGAQLVVEGIETKAQCTAVRALGARSGQGYYFSRPAPVNKFLEQVQDITQYPFDTR